ncbi:hypothetical protein BS47DRAFT_1361859 [Hydnum rufescens UP504]|uniref:Uncharacterized protein n=1 Tax=Hydnum rufescens UP504 TaxID=1448309 RepID=A0A9P6AYH7_9AGAM|nr:hypothetical protein BS47DRAFT_1361859 [Hydnum rufescens UP504]
MVPHTPRGRCVALLGPFSLRETPPEECTDRAQGIQGFTQPFKTPMVNYPQHATNQTQCHTPTLAATRTLILRNNKLNAGPHTRSGSTQRAAVAALWVSPRCTKPHPTRTQDEKWTWVATRNPIQEPSARTPTSYTTMDEIWYHTPPVGCLFSHYETPPKASTDEAQGENRARTATQRPHPQAPITGCVVMAGLPLMHETPQEPKMKNGRAQPPGTQSKNPAPEHPQPPQQWMKYHTPPAGPFSHYETPPKASTDEAQGEN